jgi:hypothetical protein
MILLLSVNTPQKVNPYARAQGKAFSIEKLLMEKCGLEAGWPDGFVKKSHKICVAHTFYS